MTPVVVTLKALPSHPLSTVRYQADAQQSDAYKYLTRIGIWRLLPDDELVYWCLMPVA